MKTQSFLPIATAGALCLSTTAALAHHGHDFLLLQDNNVPAPGKICLFSDFEWERAGATDGLAAHPGLLFGIAPQVALEAGASFGKLGGEQWDYQSISPGLHVQLTPSDSKLPFRVGISAMYEFASGDGAGHGREEQEHGAPEHGEHEEAAEHHEESAEDSHESGLHSHAEDYFEARLKLETDLPSKTRIGFNFIYTTAQEARATWEYAVGVRQMFGEHFAAGVEAAGEFESHGRHVMLAAVYWEPVHSVILKLGVGGGLTDESPDFLLRSGLVWRF